MARPRSNTNITCRNRKCEYYRKDEGKDIVKNGTPSGRQRYLCKHCGSSFDEYTDTFLHNKHWSKDGFIQICELLVEKNSIRSIERITDHHRDTIGKLLDNMTMNAEYMDDFLRNEMNLTINEILPFWETIIKNRKKLSPVALEKINKTLGAKIF